MTPTGMRQGFLVGTGAAQQTILPHAGGHKGRSKGFSFSSSASPPGFGQPTPATAPTIRVFSPWLLSSQAHVTCPSEATARTLLNELKGLLTRDIMLPTRDGTTTTPHRIWAGVLTSREDRLRNQRMNALGRCIQDHLRATCPCRTREVYQNICWKSATAVFGGRRCATLRRLYNQDGSRPNRTAGAVTETPINNGEFYIDWHRNWWGQDIFEYEENCIVDRVVQAMREL